MNDGGMDHLCPTTRWKPAPLAPPLGWSREEDAWLVMCPDTCYSDCAFGTTTGLRTFDDPSFVNGSNCENTILFIYTSPFLVSRIPRLSSFSSQLALCSYVHLLIPPQYMRLPRGLTFPLPYPHPPLIFLRRHIYHWERDPQLHAAETHGGRALSGHRRHTRPPRQACTGSMVQRRSVSERLWSPPDPELEYECGSLLDGGCATRRE